jgi:hypothetical protein
MSTIEPPSQGLTGMLLPSAGSSTNPNHAAAGRQLPVSALIGIIAAALLLSTLFLILFCFIRKRRNLRLHSGHPRIRPFTLLPDIISSKRRDRVGRRKIHGEKCKTGEVWASSSIEKATPGLENPVPEQVGTDEHTSQLVTSQTLHRQTSYASQPRATAFSIVSTERQQSLRERAESMRGGISALEAVLLNDNIREEQRHAAQAELQQLRSTMAMLLWIEQSDWARGLVEESPPAYNTLLGR